MNKTLRRKSEQILELYNEGRLLNEIAQIVTSSTVSVKKVLAENGIDYNQVKKELYEKRIAQIVPLYLEGKSQFYLEQELNLTRKTIRKILKDYDEKNYRNRSQQQQIRRGTEVNHDALQELTP